MPSIAFLAAMSTFRPNRSAMCGGCSSASCQAGRTSWPRRRNINCKTSNLSNFSSYKLHFSTTSIIKAKPSRPEPIGSIKAHFPQKHQTKYIKENGQEYISRWKTYLHDLGSTAAPGKLQGPDFGSRVRDPRGPRIWRQPTKMEVKSSQPSNRSK